ncbi:g6418 [Coccomyxa elongata]
MAGINRLGKAPPRPGSLRPPDPNRNRVLDIYSEGTEGDADYMRMVQDIEDAQQSQVGWLFGRGAFDKGDLLYLRDEEEKRRFKEEELRELERAQFLRLQAVAGPDPDSLRTAAAPPPPRATQNQRSQAKFLANIVKVKGSRITMHAKRGAEDNAGRFEKRLKEEVPSQRAQGSKQEEEEEEEGPGLAGLLGDYGSEDEEAGSDRSNGADEQPKIASSQGIKSGPGPGNVLSTDS